MRRGRRHFSGVVILKWNDFVLGSRSQDKGRDAKSEMKLCFIEKAKQLGQLDNNEIVVVQSGPALNVISVTLESKELDGGGLETLLWPKRLRLTCSKFLKNGQVPIILPVGVDRTRCHPSHSVEA